MRSEEEIKEQILKLTEYRDDYWRDAEELADRKEYRQAAKRSDMAFSFDHVIRKLKWVLS